MGALKDRMLQRKKDLAEGKYPSLELHDQDAIKWEVLYTRLLGIVQEGRETGRLISASPTVREFGECVFCVFTPEGDAWPFPGDSPSLRSFEAPSSGCSQRLRRGPWDQGRDIFCNNDPQIGGAHSATLPQSCPCSTRANSWPGSAALLTLWKWRNRTGEPLRH